MRKDMSQWGLYNNQIICKRSLMNSLDNITIQLAKSDMPSK